MRGWEDNEMLPHESLSLRNCRVSVNIFMEIFHQSVVKHNKTPKLPWVFSLTLSQLNSSVTPVFIPSMTLKKFCSHLHFQSGWVEVIVSPPGSTLLTFLASISSASLEQQQQFLLRSKTEKSTPLVSSQHTQRDLPHDF